MSDVNVESLTKELEDTKNQLKGLNAQSEASKQMLNDSLALNHQLRTNLILLQQIHQEAVNKNQGLDFLNKQLSAKVLELTPVVTEELVQS
jgi:hypothetical protein